MPTSHRPGYRVWLGGVIAVAFLADPTFAQFNWTGAATNQWNLPGNWAPTGIPGPSDTAVFDGTGPGVIDLDGGPNVVNALTFTAGNYTLGSAAGQNLSANAITHGAGANTIAARFVAGSGFAGSINGGNLALTNTAVGAGANSFPAGSFFAVNTGATLRAAISGSGSYSPGSSAVSGANLILNGGTLETHGVVVPGGLTAEFFANSGRIGNLLTGAPIPDGVGQFHFVSDARSRLNFNVQTPATLAAPNAGQTAVIGADVNIGTAIPGFNGGNGPGVIYPGFDYNNANGGAGAPFGVEGFAQADNVMARFNGRITITNAGDYTFGLQSDDGSILTINGQLLVNNNLAQSFTGAGQPRTATVNLTPGSYDFGVAFYEGTGGAGLRVTYSGPDTVVNGAAVGTLVPIPQNVLGAYQGRVDVGSPVTVNSNSTIDTRHLLAANYGNLDIAADVTLSRTGFGLSRFTQTTLNPGTGPAAYTFNTSSTSDIALGRINNANVGNPVSIVKSGAGTLLLDSPAVAPTLTGSESIDVQGGRLFLSRTSTISPLSSGSIHVPISLNSDSSILQLHAQGGTVTFDNRIFVNANATIEANGDVSANASNTFRLINVSTNPLTIADGVVVNFDVAPNMQLQFNSAIPATTGGLIKVGTGNLVIPGNNQYTGPTTVLQGTLQLNGTNSIRLESPITFAPNTTITLSGVLPLQPIQQDRLVVGSDGITTVNLQSANPLAAPLNVFGNTLLNVNNNGGVSQPVNLFPGSAFQVTGSAQAMNGSAAIRVAPGVPYRTSAGGDVVGSQFSYAAIPSGATLQIAANPTGLSNLQPNVTVEVFGGNRNLAVTSTFNGLSLTNDSSGRTLNDLTTGNLNVGPLGLTVSATSGTTLIVSEDVVTGNNPLRFGHLFPINNIQTKNGEVRLTNAANNFGTTPVTITAGMALAAAPTTNGNGGFSNETAGRAMNSRVLNGVVRLTYPGGAADPGNDLARQNLGTVDVAGDAQFNVGRFGTNRTSTLFLNQLLRSNNGTLRLLTNNDTLGGTASGSERVRFTAAGTPPPRLVVDNAGSPTTINMVAPWIMNTSGGTANFVDHDPSGSTGFTNVVYSNLDNLTGDATTIRNLTGTGTLTENGARVLAALRTGRSVAGTGALTLHTGGLIITSSSSVTVSKPITAPDGVELVFHGAGGAFHTANGQLTGTAGLTKFGGNTISLAGANNSATLFGDITINQAALAIGGSNNALGAPSNRVIFNGGQLRGTNVTIDREFIVNSTGEFQSDGANNVMVISGPISGDGRIAKVGVNGQSGTDNWGVVELTNPANSYRGGTLITVGRLRVGSDAVLGDPSGPVTIAGASVGSPATNQPGILQATGDITSARVFNVYNSGTTTPVIDTQGFTVELTGPVVGTGGLEKRGDGTLILSHGTGNGYLGVTNVTAGRLVVNNMMLSGTGRDPVTVQTGAAIGGTGSIGSNLTLNANGTLEPGFNGVGTFTVIDRPVAFDAGRFAFQINDPAPVPGALNTGDSTNVAEHDQLAVLGLSRATLTLTNPIIDVEELPGFVMNENLDYSWTIARMSSGNTPVVTGSVTFITVNAPQIDSGILAGGMLSLTVNGNHVNLNYTPVPEPASVLGICAAAGLLWRRLRRKAAVAE